MVYKVNLVVVGKIKEKNINSLIDEYSKRLGPFIKLSVKELKDEGIEKESKKISDLIAEEDGHLFILDAKGRQFTSEDFSLFLRKIDEITFVIGGPDGIKDEVKRKSNLISISSMTFTHEMCRLFLLEQVYRAMMIEKGRSYHK